MNLILDLHLHSKYSRACSPALTLENLSSYSKIKGIDLLATGDFTHPVWFKSINSELEEINDGIFTLKSDKTGTKFILGTEISLIKKHKDKTRKVHLLVYAPNLQVVEKLITELKSRSFNLSYDGRPTFGLTCKDFLKLCLDVDRRIVVIPAHACTPWFGIFGTNSGYDNLFDAFEEFTDYIPAIETGFGTNPLMNRRLDFLDNKAIVSFSDAHSLENLGREATIIQLQNPEIMKFENIFEIFKDPNSPKLSTIEFFPEKGKYSGNGHRNCKFTCSSEEAVRLKGICPVCKKSLTLGTDYRVEQIATRSIIDANKVLKNPFKTIVPLKEVIGITLNKGPATKTVQAVHENLLRDLKSEFNILLNASFDEIMQASGNFTLAENILKVREGKVEISPGYDGIYGKVKIV